MNTTGMHNGLSPFLLSPPRDSFKEVTDTENPTYADRWRESINETYPNDADEEGVLAWTFSVDAGADDVQAFVLRTLTKAARILRGYDESATFTGEELDLVRHLMPAHEVHQSGSVRWVLANYGPEETSR
jgi:hypothetical protein